jgi:thiol:disulfide interchange protein DsbD
MLLDILVNLETLFKNNLFLGPLISFLAGILTSFSPCIYPLIPITLSIIGATQVSSSLKSFYVSFIFVLGIATIYTFLGIIASLFGFLLEFLFINPFTYFLLFVIFLFLGLSFMEIIKINLPSFSFNYSPKKGMISIFILGTISAFAFVPCNFPVLGAILTLISFKKDVFYGGFCLFLFSLGQGALLILLGTFTFFIKKLPKKTKYFIMIKKIWGIVIIGVGILFLLKFFFFIL